MDAAIVVALISAGVGFASLLWTSRVSRREKEQSHGFAKELEEYRVKLDRAAKREDQQADSTARVAIHTERLLRASQDLQHRLWNIRERHFLAYLGSSRKEAAINSTLFRLAKFFAAKEMVDEHVSLGDLKRAARPTEILDLLSTIGKTFTTDELDRSGTGLETSRFMIWREEQRSMGDVATYQKEDGTASLVGYITFVTRLRSGSSTWFDTFIADMESGGMSASERMKEVEQNLDWLVEHLERPHVDA